MKYTIASGDFQDTVIIKESLLSNNLISNCSCVD